MQNLGEASWGNLGDVRVADVKPVNCNKQEPCYGSTIKTSLNPFWVWARKCIVPQIFLDHKRFAIACVADALNLLYIQRV